MELELSAVVRLATDATGIGVQLGCTFFPAAGCSGSPTPPAIASNYPEPSASNVTATASAEGVERLPQIVGDRH